MELELIKKENWLWIIRKTNRLLFGIEFIGLMINIILIFGMVGGNYFSIYSIISACLSIILFEISSRFNTIIRDLVCDSKKNFDNLKLFFKVELNLIFWAIIFTILAIIKI